MCDAVTAEILREEETCQLSINRFQATYQRACEMGAGADTSVGRMLINRLATAHAEAIQEFIDPTEKTRGWNAGRLAEVRSYLKRSELTSLELAYCTIKGVLTECLKPSNSDHTLMNAASMVYNNITISVDYRRFKEEYPQPAAVLLDNIHRKHAGSITNKINQKALRRAATLRNVELFEVTPGEGSRIGIKLIELLAESTGAIKLTLTASHKWNKCWYIHLAPETQQLIARAADFYAELSPLFRPMLCEPQPWTDLYNGGYLLPLDALHPPMVKHRRKELEELEGYDLSKVMTAINHIQKTPWRINTRLLAVAKELWDAGGNVAGLPPADLVAIPERPFGNIPDGQWKQWKEDHADVYRKWADSVAHAHRVNAKAVGERVRVRSQLAMAEELHAEPRFYYVWTCDFRGRLYPLSSYLTPQADDLGKAMLEFAEGKPLTPQGWYWLRIHVANCAGVDKVPFAERIQWVNERAEAIIATAQDPIGNRWWAELDSPWQFLAAAFEYAQAMQEGPEQYVSHLPVGMDGSCNGLQHLSAILRDPSGGKSVNLIPADKPADIYTDVLKQVIARVEYEKGHAEDATHRLYAEMWLPHLARNIVKRPVMTTPYGVRTIGIKEQILEQVRDGEFFVGYQISYRACAAWLTPIIEEAIGEVVKGAPVVMGWLKEISSRANKADKEKSEGLSWTVPGSGFRVIQRYYELEGEQIKLIIGGQRIRPLSGQLSRRIDGKRQSLGIAPNFIHSLDASMLVMTVNKLAQLGITNFAMIHDSYGTHACDVDVMNQVLRDEFVKLYSENAPMECFARDIEGIYPGIELPEAPNRGDLDIGMVRYSKYFFA